MNGERILQQKRNAVPLLLHRLKLQTSSLNEMILQLEVAPVHVYLFFSIACINHGCMFICMQQYQSSVGQGKGTLTPLYFHALSFNT